MVLSIVMIGLRGLILIGGTTCCLAVSAWAETAKTPCSIEKIGETTLEDSPTGVFQLPAKINGEPVNFIVDTGSTATLIDQEIADRLALPRHLQMEHYMAEASGMRVQYAHSTLSAFEIGGATLHDVTLILAMVPKISETAHGLLGAALLDTFDYEFDSAAGKLRTFRQSHCANAKSGAVYWSDRYSTLPFHLRYHKIIFTVSLDGHEFNAMLDSGTSKTTVTWKTALRLGMTSTSPGMVAAGTTKGLGGPDLKLFSYRFNVLKLAGETIQNPVLMISDQDLPMADMIIGADFLRAHRVYIASDDEVIYFTWNGSTGFAR